MNYTGYRISEQSHTDLINIRSALTLPGYPDGLPREYCERMGHHITEQFNDDTLPEQPQEVLVIGYINNGENLDGWLVSVDGKTDRPSGGKYHITWSLNPTKGAKPFHTNNHVDEAVMLKRPIPIDVKPEVFTGRTPSKILYDCRID